MPAKDIMTTKVVTVQAEASIEDVARRLLERGISAVPVIEANGRVVGIVSEGDLMRRTELETERRSSWWLSLFLGPEKRAARYVKTHGRLARDVMTSPAIAVDENATLPEIAELLERHGIKRVPVLRDGALVGLVSRANLIHGLVASEVSKPASATDRTIRSDILDSLWKEAGVRDKFIYVPVLNVTVSDGVVHLWGAVSSEAEREAIRVIAQNTPGVRQIEDHLRALPLEWIPV